MFLKVSLFNLLLLFSMPVMSQDLGHFGKTYPILEPDLIKVMRQRIQTLTRLGYFKKLNHSLQKRLIDYSKRPSAVKSLSTTMHPRTWVFDPSIIMPQNIYAANGFLLVKAGTRYNPLIHTKLKETLLFYNADDSHQVKWANRLDKKLKGKVKLILVKGAIPSEEKGFKKKVYFDQMGRLTKRFHIQHVPAMVRQEGDTLKISEVLP